MKRCTTVLTAQYTENGFQHRSSGKKPRSMRAGVHIGENVARANATGIKPVKTETVKPRKAVDRKPRETKPMETEGNKTRKPTGIKPVETRCQIGGNTDKRKATGTRAQIRTGSKCHFPLDIAAGIVYGCLCKVSLD